MVINLNNKNSNYRPGDKVSGEYCYVPYKGVINNDTRPTPDYKNTIFEIDLDEPICVFGRKRTKISIWSNGEDSINKEG